MVRVSIIVPVYNVEKYLRKCLDSLVNQTMRQIEIIVVNDGSKDNSQGIIDEFLEKYPDKIIALQKENGGLSDARNYGLKFCTGEYVGFVDSDDYVELDMYEKMYSKAKEENSDIVVCDYIKEYLHGQEIIRNRQYNSSKDMFIGGLAAAWNKIYKRELLVASNVCFPKGLIYEDTEFFCKIIPFINSIGYVNEPLVHYVQRVGSIANTQGEKIAMIFSIINNIVIYYKETEQYSFYHSELEYFIVRILLGSSMERICRCSNSKLRKTLLFETLEFIDNYFPRWRENKYINERISKRTLYMKMLRKWNICIFASILHFYFSRKDKKLFG